MTHRFDWSTNMTRAISIDTTLGRAIVTLTAALMLVIAAGAAMAHHGWSEYDAAKRTTIRGTISELHFGNPHVTIVVKTEDKLWNVMLAAPSRLKSRGCTAEMLAVGHDVTIEGLPHKTEDHEFRAERMILGGTTIELR
jgi:Family of unknown function (DUF6152)